MAHKPRFLWAVEIAAKAKGQWRPWGFAHWHQRSGARNQARFVRTLGHKTRVVKYTPAG